MSRYNNRVEAINDNELYENHLEVRDVTQIRQFKSPVLRFPTDKQNEQISFYRHFWEDGDKYYKLAGQYYGDPTLWWVIAQYNKKPTEQHLSVGDTVKIPFPLGIVLKYIG